MRSMTVAILASFSVACGGGGDSVPDAVPVDSVALAAAAYDPAVFDSVTWADEAAALARGGVVWSFSCMKCHGASGLGDAGFVMQGDTLRPPSLIEPEWRFAGDVDGLRRYIFSGNNEGMPHWGMVGLKYRDIDAVARYITQLLRPEPQKR